MRIFIAVIGLILSVNAGTLRIGQANSPFMVDSLLIVDTLLLDPGANVFFKAGSGITVKDLIYSVAPSNKRITLSSGEDYPTPFDWLGITIESKANVFFINTNFSNCIDCINSQSPEIVLDSCQFQAYGNSKVLLNGAPLHSCNESFFCYNPGKWAKMFPDKIEINKDSVIVKEVTAPTHEKKKQFTLKRAAIIGTIAIAVIAGVIIYNDDPIETVVNNEAIKHPNLPNQ